MGDNQYADQYGKAISGGKHGTPQWNPPPHPQADPAVVAARDTDPLWGYHRGTINYGGYPNASAPEWSREKPSDYLPILGSHIRKQTGVPGSVVHNITGDAGVDHTDSPPIGFVNEVDRRELGTATADHELTDGPFLVSPVAGHLSPGHPDNNARYQSLLGNQPGRRPHFGAVFPLQDLRHHAAPHDPYRLLAAAVLSGNRHALPPLVDLLRRRDNPAGWSSQWGKLAKAMEDRVGDLPPETVLRRVGAIAKATTRHSANPTEHEQLATAAIESDQPTAFAALADHLEENGLPQYGQLMRLELANLEHGLRQQPKRKGSRL